VMSADDRHPRRVVLLALAVLALAGCATEAPIVTPTATRTPILPTATGTPIPTSTPTATATNTPTPTPTLPPGLAFPQTSVPAPACPPTTADLLFVRNKTLWACPSDGGAPRQLTGLGAGGGEVHDYVLSDDGRRIAYVTQAGEAWILDSDSGEHTHLPTAGRLLDTGQAGIFFTGTGQSLAYLAWGVQTALSPAPGSDDSAALLALDITSPTLRQRELADCQSVGDRPCHGALASPDGRQVAIFDGLGIRLVSAPEVTEPRLLAIPPAGDALPVSWSPDRSWLLVRPGIQTDQETSPAYVLLSTAATGETLPAPVPLCSSGCEAATAWSNSVDGQRLWLTWDDGTHGCIGSVDVDTVATHALPVAPTNQICEAQTADLRPDSPMGGPSALSLGGLLVFHQDSAEGISSGIYAITAQAELRGVALLPDAGGDVQWAPDGGSFLYTDGDGNASRIGAPAYGVLWDVADLLAGTDAHRWQRPPSD